MTKAAKPKFVLPSFRSRMVPVNHRLAEQLLSLPILPWQMRPNHSYAARLAKRMKQGQFFWPWVIMLTATVGRKRYLCNGTHCMWAVLEVPEKLLRDKIVELRSVRLKNLDALREYAYVCNGSWFELPARRRKAGSILGNKRR